MREAGDVEQVIVRWFTVQAQDVSERRPCYLAEDLAPGREPVIAELNERADSRLSRSIAKVVERVDANLRVEVLRIAIQHKPYQVLVPISEVRAVGAEEHADDLLEYSEREDMEDVVEARRAAGRLQQHQALGRPVDVRRAIPVARRVVALDA